ncbi:hypothetical protein [Actinokineospora iranica]|uniref:hypothetical protein n=1 Tax=Actinokineospora iranica TaxID=1271860 RepID=UPI00111402BA|nr:hypothetical protein [Actinokineospora iranica]
MATPPHDPYGDQPPRPAYDPYSQPARPPARGHQPYGQPQYRQPEYRQPSREPVTPQRFPRHVPGLGLVLATVGSLIQLLSLTVLPWAARAASDDVSLPTLWKSLTDGDSQGFGDWYVVLFSYPLIALGVVLAFAAVLESVAMKVVWGGLMLLGLGYLVLRYGLGPLTGLFGSPEPMSFTTAEIILAAGALIAVVLVALALKLAVSTFRRVAGVILLALSGIHLTAVMDLVDATAFSDLSIGAFTPSVGYLLTGAAALIGPRRLIPGH